MNCTHSTPIRYVWEDVEVSPYGDTERQLVERGGEGTYEDCGVGRFRCTQCKQVFYYTGLWKEYYENGTPCSGSEGVPRD